MTETFERILTGGHPNSLGRTLEVVDTVLANPDRMADLYACYQSRDEVVRLRTSSAIRKVQAQDAAIVHPFIDRLIGEIGQLDQASAQWTLAILFDVAKPDMTDDQKARAKALMMRNLAEHGDWIVLNNSIDVLTRWSADDDQLREWLPDHLKRLSNDPRKSVSKRAAKALDRLAKTT